MRTSRFFNSSPGFCAHCAAINHAACTSPRVRNAGDCQRSHWPTPSMSRRAQATTCTASSDKAVSELVGTTALRRVNRSARPSQSNACVCGS